MDDEISEGAESDLCPDIPWPDVPRQGFGDGEPRRLTSDLRWAQRYGMYGYVEGYARAARAVFEAADQQNPNYFIWPLAFLWRHHLEIALKEIIAAGRELGGRQGKFPPGHDLLKLWQEAKCHIRRCGPHDSPELRNVEANVVEFQKIDPAGDGFRYPRARDMRSMSLPDAPEQVNLATLQDAMEAVAAFLSAVRTEMGVRLDYISEQESHR
jgi:hypothetical protein